MAELAALPLTYTPTWGTDALRAAIAGTYERVESDDVLVFAGAEEALFWALQELVGPGDHAVVTVPNYQSMESVTLATGAEVSGLRLDPRRGWALDLDALESLLRPTTRLVAVNFPNNPTGALPDPATWDALLALCEERGVRLFSDEVYRGLEADGVPALDQARRPVRPRAVAGRALEGLRAAGPAHRLARLPRPAAARAAGDAQALHDDLQCRPERIDRRRGAAPAREITARNRAIIAANVVCSTPSSPAPRSCSHGSPPTRAASASRAIWAPTASRPSARRCSRGRGGAAAGVDLRLGAGRVPDDRFRIGVGRADPEPALAAFGAFLRDRAG